MKKMTGSSPRSADLRMPLVSRAFDGITTTSPGVCMNHASRLLLCCAAKSATPEEARIRSGTGLPQR